MQVSKAIEWLSNLNPEDDIIAFWWTKEDAEDNANYKISRKDWLTVINSINGGSYESELIDAINRFVRASQSCCGGECNCKRSN